MGAGVRWSAAVAAAVGALVALLLGHGAIALLAAILAVGLVPVTPAPRAALPVIALAYVAVLAVVVAGLVGALDLSGETLAILLALLLVSPVLLVLDLREKRNRGRSKR